MKTCTACGVEKPEDQFAKQRSGRRSYCKPCGVIATAEWMKKNPDKARRNTILAARRFRERHPDRVAVSRAKCEQHWKIREAKRDPIQRKAMLMVKRAREAGKIVRPDSCSICGAGGPIEGHHPDYSKPLEVQWLCKKCHGLTRRILV